MRITRRPVEPLRGAPFPAGTRVSGSLTFDSSSTGAGARTTVSFDAPALGDTSGAQAARVLDALARALRGEPMHLPDDADREQEAADAALVANAQAMSPDVARYTNVQAT